MKSCKKKSDLFLGLKKSSNGNPVKFHEIPIPYGAPYPVSYSFKSSPFLPIRGAIGVHREAAPATAQAADGTAPEMQMAGKWVIFQVMTGKNTRDYQGESMDMPFNGKFGAEIDGFNRVYPNFLYGF